MGRIALKLKFFIITSSIWSINSNNQSIWLGHVRSWWILTIQKQSYVRFDHFLCIFAYPILYCALRRLHCAVRRLYCALTKLDCAVARLHCVLARHICTRNMCTRNMCTWNMCTRTMCTKNMCAKNMCFFLWNIWFWDVKTCETWKLLSRTFPETDE